MREIAASDMELKNERSAAHAKALAKKSTEILMHGLLLQAPVREPCRKQYGKKKLKV